MSYFADTVRNGFSTLFHHFIGIDASDFDNIAIALEESDLDFAAARQIDEVSNSPEPQAGTFASSTKISTMLEVLQDSCIARAESPEPHLPFSSENACQPLAPAHWLRV